MVSGIGAFEQPEPAEPAPLCVGEEGEARAEAGAEGRLDLGRIDAEDDDARVGDLELVLEPAELAHVALLLGAPPAARAEQDERIAAGELGQAAVPTGVVGEVQVGEGRVRDKLQVSVRAARPAAEGVEQPLAGLRVQ